jgi:hypothetical protein
LHTYASRAIEKIEKIESIIQAVYAEYYKNEKWMELFFGLGRASCGAVVAG